MFRLEFQPEAEKKLDYLQRRQPKIHKKVLKTLGLMQEDRKHPSLKTHKFKSLAGPNGEEIWECYVDTDWRVFWYDGPGQGVMTIFAMYPKNDKVFKTR